MIGAMIVGIEPVGAGYIERSGQRIHWQEFGAGEDAVLLMPTWSIVHSDFWRQQVPFLSQQHRVVTFDGLGNGASDRPLDPSYYGDLPFADDGVAVLDACGIERAAIAGVSQGGPWALALAARHPERVTAAIFIAPNVPLAPGHPVRVAAGKAFLTELAEYPGWSKWNKNYWLQDYPGFLRFFFAQCFTERDSEPQIEHFFQMGMQTNADVLLATTDTDENDDVGPELALEYAKTIRCPSFVIHGDEDAITPLARGTELARLCGAELVIMRGSGHEPHCRDPDETNQVIGGFLAASLGR
jgi:pimeloyl-ACP methyl ester carboxylesterase